MIELKFHISDPTRVVGEARNHEFVSPNLDNYKIHVGYKFTPVSFGQGGLTINRIHIEQIEETKEHQFKRHEGKHHTDRSATAIFGGVHEINPKDLAGVMRRSLK